MEFILLLLTFKIKRNSQLIMMQQPDRLLFASWVIFMTSMFLRVSLYTVEHFLSVIAAPLSGLFKIIKCQKGLEILTIKLSND